MTCVVVADLSSGCDDPAMLVGTPSTDLLAKPVICCGLFGLSAVRLLGRSEMVRRLRKSYRAVDRV